jgi:ribonuclease BN (tRNA processing enzyme)
VNSPLVRFLGTGTAFNSDGRGSQAIMVRPAAASPFLVDIGPTALQAMARLDIERSAIDRLFLTHLHGDHTAGWPFLLLHQLFVAGRRRPFHVHGPEGARERLEALALHCYGELLERREFDLHYHEFPAEERAGVDGRQGMAFDILPMRHHQSSVGLRFRMPGLTLAVSGDTGWCENLERLGDGCDLLILECTSARKESETHLCLDEIRANRERLGRCQVILVHLTDDVAQELALDPIPMLFAAHDGMIWRR